MNVAIDVTERFFDFVFDWDYETYLLIGGYGSGKSYAVAEKIVLKCLQEKRKVLVVREVYDTIKESCFALFLDILSEMDMIANPENIRVERKYKVVRREAPMSLTFPNGSRIIFKGMDKPEKVKSIHGVSIVWLEECSEIKYAGYEELLGRIRTQESMHFILSCNPVARENWVYQHFFVRTDDEGLQKTIVKEDDFYRRKTMVHNGVYYHHSTPDDNPHLPARYVQRLDEIQEYDKPLWRVARYGRFGAAGTRVLPQFTIATDPQQFVAAVKAIPWEKHYFGMDFGFEESYNAVLSMAVDEAERTLYIYDEVYVNGVTDPEMAARPEMQRLKMKLANLFPPGAGPDDPPIVRPIVADNEDPKAIKFYRDNGFVMRGCKNKFAGSRLSNTRKVKRFKKIVCSPRCKNTIRELHELTYKRDSKGNVIYDQFNIDPHTFSAIWYALDTCNVADVKDDVRNSKSGVA